MLYLINLIIANNKGKIRFLNTIFEDPETLHLTLHIFHELSHCCYLQNLNWDTTIEENEELDYMRYTLKILDT